MLINYIVKSVKSVKENNHDRSICNIRKCNAYINTNVLKLPAPTQSIAQKWLRETKNIHICVYNCACGYGYEISKADNGTHITSSVYEGTNDGGEWDTYEEVLETGLQEALKLI